MFSSRSFSVLGSMFRSLIHLELDFGQGGGWYHYLGFLDSTWPLVVFQSSSLGYGTQDWECSLGFLDHLKRFSRWCAVSYLESLGPL